MFSKNTMSLWKGIYVLLLSFTLVMMTGCDGGAGGMTPSQTPTVSPEAFGNGQFVEMPVNAPATGTSFAREETQHATAQAYMRLPRPGQNGQVEITREEITLLGFVHWRASLLDMNANFLPSGNRAGWEVGWNELLCGRQGDFTVTVEVDPEALADYLAARFVQVGGGQVERRGRGLRAIIGGLFGGVLINALVTAAAVDPTANFTVKDLKFADCNGGPVVPPTDNRADRAVISPKQATIKVNENVQFTGTCYKGATVLPHTGMESFTVERNGAGNGYINAHGKFTGTAKGTVTVRFTCYPGGPSDTAVVTITDPVDPGHTDCTLIVTPATGNTTVERLFEVDVDSSHQATSYEWDFTNNGSVDARTNENRVRFTYTTAGVYTAHVRVITQGGEDCEDTVTVTVTDGGGNPDHPLMWGDEEYDPDQFTIAFYIEGPQLDLDNMNKQHNTILMTHNGHSPRTNQTWFIKDRWTNAGTGVITARQESDMFERDPESGEMVRTVDENGNPIAPDPTHWDVFDTLRIPEANRPPQGGNDTYLWKDTVVLNTTRNGQPEPTEVEVSTFVLVFN